MNDTLIQIAVFAILLVALTAAYWTGRNRSRKGKVAIGLICLPIAALLTAYARHSVSAAWQQSELAAYAYLTIWSISTVIAVGLPMWALSDWFQSKLSPS